jgi:hypothetical protein
MARKFLGSASLLAPLILAAMVVAGRADDGVVLINQSKVMAVGHFPYTIKTPGSYRLAGNLTVPGGNGIDVSATPVSIDLNGFTITGQNSGVGIGVMTAPGSQTTLAVSNGTIQNFNIGVDVSGGGLLTVNNLTVLNASDEAFYSNAPARFSHVSISALIGIDCSSSCILDGALVNASTIAVIGEPGVKMVATNNVILTGRTGFLIGPGSGADLLDNNVASNSSASVTGVSAILSVGTTAVVAVGRNVFNLPGGICLDGSITSLGDNVCNGTKR